LYLGFLFVDRLFGIQLAFLAQFTERSERHICTVSSLISFIKTTRHQAPGYTKSLGDAS